VSAAGAGEECRDDVGGVPVEKQATVHSRRAMVARARPRDSDGHRFTLGRGEEALRDVADDYGLDGDEISVGPPWLQRRQG